MRERKGHEVGSLIPTINSIYEALTKSEQKVADYVLKNAKSTIYNSINDLADMADVGVTTVMRFCRKTGYKGYQEFKMALAQDLTVNPNVYNSDLGSEINDLDGVLEVSHKTFNSTIQALNETMSLLNKNDIEKAVNYMTGAKKIVFFGVGTSAVTALDAKYRFLRIGLEVDCCQDSHMQAMQATLLTSEDVAVGISFSGSTKDTVDVLTLAKNSGAKTICITHHARSPITKFADVVLLNGSKEDPLQGGAITSKISQLMVIDMLYNNIFLRMKAKAIKYKEKTSKAVLEKLF